ncbi:MAG: ribbon-helix-helix protein, CopG family [Thermodesulfobacteriota bacterium]
MDKVLSARVDERVLHQINMLAKELHTSKKSVIEEAILTYVKKIEAEKGMDVLDLTSGVWKRDESAEETSRKARAAFTKSMERHRK